MNLSFLSSCRDFDVDSALRLLRSGGMITMSWGINNVRSLKHSKYVRGLAFDVNGNHFMGTVVLSVNGSDYYDIRFFKGDIMVNELTDVVLYNVIESIDEYVEKIADYKF